MATQAWPNRPFYFKPSCGIYPYQLHNFDFRDLKYSQKRPETAGKTKMGGGN